MCDDEAVGELFDFEVGGEQNRVNHETHETTKHTKSLIGLPIADCRFDCVDSYGNSFVWFVYFVVQLILPKICSWCRARTR